MARAYYMLYQIHAALGSDPEVQKRHRDAAFSCRAKVDTDLNPAEKHSEEDFTLLMPWMLW